MAYNLLPLVQILSDLVNERFFPDKESRSLLKFWLKKATSFSEILEKVSLGNINARESLEGQIRNATHKAQDMLESHVVDQIFGTLGNDRYISELQKIVGDFFFAMDQVMNIVERGQHHSSSSTMVNVSFQEASCMLDTSIPRVGLDRDLHMLKVILTLPIPRLSIVAISGMGGIGKTTLARILYNDPIVKDHIGLRAWITMHELYDVRAICLDLLRSFGMLTDTMLGENSEKLGELVYNALMGKRYFVVLDNMWDTELWDKIKMFFPKNCTSAIVIITRQMGVARAVCTPGNHHRMRLLNEMESWELLRKKVFDKENCPAELEKIGRKIAYECRGLPLTIHVIGELLAENRKEKGFWEHVAEDVNSAATRKDSKLLEVLYLSYDRLPNHLRPCLLYAASFPEICTIRASKLMNLLLCEDFIVPNICPNLERFEKDYLEALVDMNLIFVKEQKHQLKVQSYGMHNLLRDLCIRLSGHEEFILVNKGRLRSIECSPHRARRVIFHPNQRLHDFADVASEYSSSFISTDYSARLYVPDFGHVTSKLLKILDLLDIVFREFPEEILKLVNIRYLALTCYSDLPSGIFNLWKLQTLVYRVDSDSRVKIPSTFWSLTQLRHFKFMESYFWVECGSQVIVLENLQTVSYIDASNFASHGFVRRMPYVRKLGLCCEMLKDAIDLSSLNYLESVKIHNIPDSLTSGPVIKFPYTVTVLTLSECRITDCFTTSVGSMSSLIVLKIRKCNFVDRDMEPRWKLGEGQFRNLEYLLLEDLDLCEWQADKSNFKNLNRLVIRYCSQLQELPGSLGETVPLKLVEIDEWSPSVVASAKRLQAEHKKRLRGFCWFEIRIRGLGDVCKKTGWLRSQVAADD